MAEDEGEMAALAQPELAPNPQEKQRDMPLDHDAEVEEVELGDTSISSIQSLGDAEDGQEGEDHESRLSPGAEEDLKLIEANLEPKQRVSIYVQVFEEMIETVMAHESHLFNEEEHDLLARFGKMSYAARYLFVRLFSRKNGWFRISRLGYYDEIGDMTIAANEVCQYEEPDEPVAGPSVSPSPAPSEIIAIDDDDEDEHKKPIDVDGDLDTDPMTNRTVEEVKKDEKDFGLSRFAINEKILAERSDIDELLSLLSLDELKALAKELKVGGKQTRPWLIASIKRSTSNQSTLTSMFAMQSASKAKGKGRMPRKDDLKTQVARQTQLVMRKILQHLGPCIKLESAPIRLFARLHLLYYRSVSYSEKTLTQAVLARFKIRHYPSYAVKRSFNIFESRQALVDYEDALLIERKMEEHLGEALDSKRGRGPITKEEREQSFREAVDLFEEIYPRWQQLVKEAQEKDIAQNTAVKDEDGVLREPPDDRLTYYRKRFIAGWPLTRVVYKGAKCLARLHEYDREVEVLQALLSQTCFRRGKRGEWYDRLALVLMNHTEGDKGKNREEALRICFEGLAHPWTHLIYHNSLQRRIVRLQSALAVPDIERLPAVANLRAAKKRIMKAEKLSEGETGKKAVWRGMDGAEISVEQLSLECYEKEGWRGFHSENGILTTIFALLFWDVIFIPLDGVFETAYQSAPLDLATDAFSIVRAEQIKERLDLIASGRALDILKATDERERERKTFCVGVRWYYETEDLVEIVQCFSPRALVTICRVYAEEWSHRTGGVPDLFLWNFEEKVCRFVEVKGPGDILSETQKVWIDVLLSTDVQVELCSVKQIMEEEEWDLSDTGSRKPTPARVIKRRTESVSVPPAPKRRASKKSESEESDYEDEKKPVKVKKPKRSVSKDVAKKTGKKAKSASGKKNKKQQPCLTAGETIILSDSE